MSATVWLVVEAPSKGHSGASYGWSAFTRSINKLIRPTPWLLAVFASISFGEWRLPLRLVLPALPQLVAVEDDGADGLELGQ
jgi:hypothetical protein